METEEEALDQQIEHLKQRLLSAVGEEKTFIERCLVDLMTRRVALGAASQARLQQEVANLQKAWDMIQEREARK
jgi:hypothetical protein